MPTAFRINFDISDWRQYGLMIDQLARDFPELQAEFLTSVAARYREAILDQMLINNTRYTGTYEQSVMITRSTLRRRPVVSLIIEPQGPGADRLPIYWKVIEFGARPNPDVPLRPIKDWTQVKFGNRRSGWYVARNIKQYGIQPRPVLQTIFEMAGPESIDGLTPYAVSIAENEAWALMNKLEAWFTELGQAAVPTTFLRAGRSISQFRLAAGQSGGGRFARVAR